MIKKAFLYLLLLLMIRILPASHVLGGYIRYENQGGYKYKISAVVYRDCRGISLTTPTFGVFSGTNGGNACGNYSLTGFTLKSIREITPRCSTDTAACDPQNTYSTGQGIEEFIYEKNIDLSQSPYSGFLNNSSCCEITFYMGWTGRTGFTSGCQFGTNPCDNYYTISTINTCNLKKCADTTNSAPLQYSSPVIFPACNQTLSHSTGFSDKDQDDSLKFRLACPLSGLPNTSVSYSSPFSCKYFMSPYCVPTSSISCTPNPNTNPPRGLFFDTLTGDLIAVPTKCNELYTYVPEVTEFRKDTSGNWVVIGRSRRDHAAYVLANYGYNKSPFLTGPKMNKVCAGDKICFQITGYDETFTPYQTIPDTVAMWWDTAIPAAKFTIKNPADREKTAEFCWQTHDSDARETFYRFTAFVSDQHCSPPMIHSRTFLIKVNPGITGSFSYIKKPCGTLLLSAKKDPDFKDSVTAFWRITDSSGNVLYNGSGMNDTAGYLPAGRFIVKLTLATLKQCAFSLQDTVIMPELPQVSLGSDTWACKKSHITLAPVTIAFAAKPYTYSWIVNGISNPADSMAQKTIYLTKDTLAIIKITDSNDCVFSDSVVVFSKPLPQVFAGADKRICFGDTAIFLSQVSPGGGSYAWNTGGTTSQLSVSKAGNYILNYSDSIYKCTAADTVTLFVNDSIHASAGPDIQFCKTAAVSLQASHHPKTLPATFEWRDLKSGGLLGTGQNYWFSSANPFPDGSRDTVFKMKLIAAVLQSGLQCYAEDTIKITIHSLPIVRWIKPKLDPRCWEPGDIILEPFVVAPLRFQWQAGNFRIFGLKGKDGIVDSLAFDVHIANFNKLSNEKLSGGVSFEEKIVIWHRDTNGCANSDTTILRINPNPVIVLDTSYYCQDKGWADLDSSIIRPKTKFGSTFTWKLLRYPSGIDTQNILFPINQNKTWLLNFGAPDQNQYAGKYELVLKVTSTTTGCYSEDSTVVIIVPEPHLSSSDPNPFCAGSDVDLTSIFYADNQVPANNKTQYSIYSHNGYSHTDSFGDAVIIKNFLKNAKSGVWSILCENEEYGCPISDTFDLTVVPRPHANFKILPNDSIPVNDTKVKFQNLSSIESGADMKYTWYFEYPSTQSSSTIVSPEIIYPATDSTYKVLLIANTDWCSDTAEAMLVVGLGHYNTLHELSGANLRINQRFQISGIEFTGIDICIFDASGRIVACAEDNKGIDLIPGTYFYRILLDTPSGTAMIRGKKVVEN